MLANHADESCLGEVYVPVATTGMYGHGGGLIHYQVITILHDDRNL